MPAAGSNSAGKPFSQACENNKRPILASLERHLGKATGVAHVLEIGSGTGQHAVWFAAALPHLVWQCSDRIEHHAGIRAWIDEARCPNLPPPLELDVRTFRWSAMQSDAVFSANAVHIMSWTSVEALFAGVGEILSPGGILCLYGPFNYGGHFTSESNARFEEWLKSRDPESGIRDFETVDALARSAGLDLRTDEEMPANNRLLTWQKPGDRF